MYVVGSQVTVIDAQDEYLIGHTRTLADTTPGELKVKDEMGTVSPVREVGEPGELSDTKATLRKMSEHYRLLRMETEQLKHDVASSAVRLAEEHDWCGVVVNALHDLGLQDYIPRKTGTMTITVNVPVEADFGTSDDDLRYAVDLSIESSDSAVDFNTDRLDIGFPGTHWDD